MTSTKRVRMHRRRLKSDEPIFNAETDRAIYLPTPEEIAAACAEIRATRQDSEPQPLALDKVYKRPRI